MGNFDLTLESLILQMNEKISDLCERLSKIERQIELQTKSEKKKRETIYILIAGVSSFIAIYKSVF